MSDMERGVGSRGGSIPPLTLAEAQTLFRNWKQDEWGWLKIKIIAIAARRQEFHADYIVGHELSERNMIGAAVNALVKQGYLRSTGEHRKGRSTVSHGRKSYVYGLTSRGWSLAEGLPPDDGSSTDDYEQRGLF